MIANPAGGRVFELFQTEKPASVELAESEIHWRSNQCQSLSGEKWTKKLNFLCPFDGCGKFHRYRKEGGFFVIEIIGSLVINGLHECILS